MQNGQRQLSSVLYKSNTSKKVGNTIKSPSTLPKPMKKQIAVKNTLMRDDQSESLRITKQGTKSQRSDQKAKKTDKPAKAAGTMT